MTRREATHAMLAGAVVAAAGQTPAGEPISLPAPATRGGMPLMQALSARHSTREYTDRPLSRQMLSDLLWAAFGINRGAAIARRPTGGT